uniref:Uncharacterized protein n=1 Tax=Oryza sativa subsp. japonica TaxID=39947 RepID=Q8H2K4_ORYSJ|nr:hypothetical protein [Oryza sativa Japonica Group]
MSSAVAIAIAIASPPHAWNGDHLGEVVKARQGRNLFFSIYVTMSRAMSSRNQDRARRVFGMEHFAPSRMRWSSSPPSRTSWNSSRPACFGCIVRGGGMEEERKERNGKEEEDKAL